MEVRTHVLPRAVQQVWHQVAEGQKYPQSPGLLCLGKPCWLSLIVASCHTLHSFDALACRWQMLLDTTKCTGLAAFALNCL